MKLSEAIKLVEKHTGKKVILSPKKKTLKESLGSNTTKFIKELLDDKIAITKGQLLIIVNEFFENFETVSEFQIFDKKVKTGNKTVLTSLGKIISKETGIVLTKVSKVLDSIMSNIEDAQEFKKVYIEVEKGLLGEFINKNVPASIKGNYVASTNNAPKVNSPKVNAPKVDTPKVNAPKVNAPKADTEWLDKMGIRNYTINSDGTVDVDGYVHLSRKRISTIPVQFRNVKGSFDCSENYLTSLQGSPQKVGGYFDCSKNDLTSLQGLPKEVVGGFYCSNNNLTSLQGSPQKVEGDFYCANNNLTNLEGSPKEVGGNFSCTDNKLTNLQGSPQKVKGDFYCDDNKLTSLQGSPKEVGEVFSCTNNKLTSLAGVSWDKLSKNSKEQFKHLKDTADGAKK